MVIQKQGERDRPDLAPIFSAPVRWGYEFVPPSGLQLSPERNHPPVMRQVAVMPVADNTDVEQLKKLMYWSAGVALVLDLVVLTARLSAVYFLISLVAVGLSIWAAARFRAKVGPGGPKTGETVAIIVTAFIIPPLGLFLQGLRAQQHSGMLQHQRVADPADVAAAQREHERAVADWQRRIAEFEQSEQRRVNETECWFPVVPSPGSHLICAFGGSSRTWAFALATIGGSMLGSGRRVLVVDLSRRTSVDGLWELAARQGYPVVPAAPPSQSPMLPGVAGMSWDSLTTILSEVSQSAQRDAAVSRHERHEDRAVLREVAGCLDPDGLVSITRLEAALHVVVSAGAPRAGGAICEGEYDRLAMLYNDVQRQHGGVMERVTRLERMLRGLHLLENPAGGPGGPADSAALRVASIDKRADELDNEILSDLYFQLLLQSMREGVVDADFLVLLGADRISRNSLEILGTYSEREQLPVLLFFEHLRDDAVQVIGGGGAAAVFFTLANHREAKEAADFIGRQYKWVESQRTRAYSESLTRSRGTEESENVSESHTFGLTGSSGMRHTTQTTGRSVGETLSEAIARSGEYSSSEQRVREAVIEPEVLMGLPVTGMICVEVQPDGTRVAANVDCHPKINYIPRVSKVPRPRSPQRFPMRY
jgi:hypothetical protein